MLCTGVNCIYLLANSSVSLQRVDDWLLTDSDMSVLACQPLYYIYIYIVRSVSILILYVYTERKMAAWRAISAVVRRCSASAYLSRATSPTFRSAGIDPPSQGALEVGEWTACVVYLLAFNVMYTREGRTQVVVL